MADDQGYWGKKFEFDKENSRRISRQACLNTAVETMKILSEQGKINSNITDIADDVIKLAGKYEGWVREAKEY